VVIMGVNHCVVGGQCANGMCAHKGRWDGYFSRLCAVESFLCFKLPVLSN